MDLMVAASILYGRWCLANKGKAADGSPMVCWEALSGEQRATWTAVSESAYHHVRRCLDEAAAREPGYTPPSRDGVGSRKAAPSTVAVSNAQDALQCFGHGCPDERRRQAKDARDAQGRRDYERYVAAHRERDDMSGRPAWDDLSEADRVHFFCLAESAHWSTDNSMQAHRAAMDRFTKQAPAAPWGVWEQAVWALPLDLDQAAERAPDVIREPGRTHHVSAAGVIGRTVVHAVEQDKAAPERAS